jgi:two-component system, chemotaxis family, chemotaxis protein CheY
MKRVLIVDDEPLFRTILNEYISEFAECYLASNGEEALEMYDSAFASGHPYYLVLLDIYMPVMDGHTLLRSIREREAAHSIEVENRIKAVVISAGNSPRQVADTFFEDQCDDYIIKPFQFDALKALLIKFNVV